MINNFERSWVILNYLRWNSDQEHPVSRAAMMKDSAMLPYVEGKGTFNDAIFHMALAMNCGDNEMVLPPEQWKISYQAFLEKYGGEKETEDGSDEIPKGSGEKESRLPIRGLHYRHTFSYEEINALIEGILFSRTLDSQTANRIVEKIEDHLTTKFYKKGPKNICTVREAVPADRERLRENLLLIQRAIDDRVKIAFRFNGYDRRRELVPVRAEKDIVSPYYLVANGGRYYLLACKDGESEQKMSIWRVDLMTELEIPGRTERCRGKRALEKREVNNLPREWSEDFLFQHLNMAYDKPIPITLRIHNPWMGRDGQLWTNYTFLYDWFGDTFRYERTEADGDIVRVMCSPFAMVNWALQYADRVEVLGPPDVREKVVEKIRILNCKYGIDRNLNAKTENQI